MNVLFVSNLFPDTTEPGRGIYNARLVRHLAAHCDIRVVSPRPALPFLGAGDRRPQADDVSFKPAFPIARYIPKIGSLFNHRLMARSLRGVLQRLREEFAFDVVLASWLYPDACAVSLLAREMEFPFVAIAQGSDAHQYLDIPPRRKIMTDCLAGASAIVTRSAELARLISDAGVDSGKLQTIYNGVDLERFCPGDKNAARGELELHRADSIILFVGNFYPIKNPMLLVRAHAELCDQNPNRVYRLIMIGDGPQMSAARQEADNLGFSKWVQFPGRISPDQVAGYMRAADALCVPSDNEGVPNVILEAFATGLGVVATDVGGIPEVMPHEFLGTLVESNDAAQMAGAIRDEIDRESRTKSISDYAGGFSWKKTASAYFDVLKNAT